VPVKIRDADAPIGTHLYTALDYNEDRSAMRWQAVTLATAIPSHPAVAAEPERHKGDKRTRREERAEPIQASQAVRLAAAAALDRIEIPKETVERISSLLSPGASLIISDYGMSGETGKYTDFIITTPNGEARPAHARSTARSPVRPIVHRW